MISFCRMPWLYDSVSSSFQGPSSNSSSSSSIRRSTAGPVLAVQRGGEAEELAAGELVVDEGPVGDEPEARLGLERLRVDVDAAHLDRAARRPEDPGDHPDGGGLAGAVRAQQAEQLAPGHLERRSRPPR